MKKDNKVKRAVLQQIKDKLDRGYPRGALNMLKECHVNSNEVQALLNKITTTHSRLSSSLISLTQFGEAMEDVIQRTRVLVNELETF